MTFKDASVRNLEQYNAKNPEEALPYIVIVVDEMADLIGAFTGLPMPALTSFTEGIYDIVTNEQRTTMDAIREIGAGVSPRKIDVMKEEDKKKLDYFNQPAKKSKKKKSYYK